MVVTFPVGSGRLFLDKSGYSQEIDDGNSIGGATWSEPIDAVENDDAVSSSSTFSNSFTNNQVGPKNTRFSLELSHLPSQDGQFWIVYDIVPYTERFPNLDEPQNSIVDWILFDSGKDFWRKEPFCVLSATRERLYVYHNSSVQRYVSNIVDRFIDPTKQNEFFTVKIVAIQSPEWRLRVTQYLAPTSVLVKGNGVDVQGWLVENTDMEKVFSEISRRPDFTLINENQKTVPNGVTFGWTAAVPRKTFSRDYQLDSSFATGYAADISSVDEGYGIEVTPLLSTTGDALEVGIHYNSTVVGKMKTFSMYVPTPSSPRQQLEIQRPEIISCDIGCKISIPRTKSAIIDLGMAPLALNKKNGNSNGGFVESFSNIVFSKSTYYNVLIVISSAK